MNDETKPIGDLDQYADPDPKATEGETPQLDPSFEQEEIGPCRIKLKIQVAPEKVAQLLEERFRALNETVGLPGFRRGHVPRPLLERKFGTEVREDLRQELLRKSLEEVVPKAHIHPVGTPSPSEPPPLRDNEPFAYEITLDVMPTIEVRDYFGIEVERRPVEVTDREIDEAIEELRLSKAEWVPADDQPTAHGDQIVADFALRAGDEVLERAENGAIQLTSGIRIHGVPVDGFVQAAIGHRVGEEFSVPFGMPNDHPSPQLAGKSCTVSVRIKAIKRLSVPNVDEAFLRELDMDSVEELREETRRRLRRAKLEDEDERLKDEILQIIMELNAFPMPASLIEAAQAEAESSLRARLFLQSTMMDEKEVERILESRRSELRQLGETAVRQMLLIEHIAEKERIFATEEMVEERITQMAQRHGCWPHEMRQMLEEQNLVRPLRREIRAELVRQELLRRAHIREAG